MTGAFQRSAFQNNAFQVGVSQEVEGSPSFAERYFTNIEHGVLARDIQVMGASADMDISVEHAGTDHNSQVGGSRKTHSTGGGSRSRRFGGSRPHPLT